MQKSVSVVAAIGVSFLIATSGGVAAAAEDIPGEEPIAEFTLETVSELSEGFRSLENRASNLRVLNSKPSGKGTERDLLLAESSKGKRAVIDATLLGSDSQSSHATSAVGAGFVDLSWADVSVIGQYDVFRDGVLLASTEESSFRDAQVQPGVSYSYQVSTSIEKPRDLWTDEQLAAFEADATVPQSGQNWGFEVTTPKSDENLDSLLSEVSAASTNSALMAIHYQTFIRPSTITADVPGSCKYTAPDYYAGDGRGFALNSHDYRTNSEVQVYWGWYPNNPDVYFQKRINTGITMAYNEDGRFLESAQAVPSQTVTNMGGNASAIDFRVSFQAGDPFCYFGSIAVVYNASLTRTGNYAVGGTHRGAPDHQIVLRRGDYDANYNITSKRKFIYTREQASILCLVGGACPELQIATQGTY